MVWPVAALAVLLLGFVVVYGSVVQSRLATAFASGTPDAAGHTPPDHAGGAPIGRAEDADEIGSPRTTAVALGDVVG